ncbi:preprotein translocase subunit SecF [Nocardioides dokdonensis FR1436]|uniref:Protein-export membrane protein SecF n=1 Tax=Nocardioides dokdonensis FR1436 TaxID=1300347 RepID=A0A1A9GM75_9ACTN|nr:protein translocase subunit SecF [Nocardioides dokdonensis]ANH39384.1 preprotein translocase subunit SecF [Nocardioides dokdonensis FR1436]
MGRYSRLGNALYTGDRSIDFVGKKWLWYAISVVLVAVAILGVSVRGLDLGIEFTGGTQYRVSLGASATQQQADELRASVSGTGVDGAASPVVSTLGEQALLVQTGQLSQDDSDTVARAIVEATGIDPAADLSQEDIGASWGADVARSSLIGLAVFLFFVILFIWAYFREWKMSVAALVALAHDVAITVGVYALLGFEVTPATVTGLLTILAFSLYDTVVVFDKVRENTAGLGRGGTTYARAANLAVNQTLVRSINTSLVALLPVGAILYVSAVQLGASSLQDLALALFVGMAAGTYSSVFIATPLLVDLKSGETEVVMAERRAKARARAGDRYAAVPGYVEGMAAPVEPGTRPGPAAPIAPSAPVTAPRTAPPRATEPMGRGRTVPQARGPVGPSGASGRQQPSRQSRSKRGKK